MVWQLMVYYLSVPDQDEAQRASNAIRHSISANPNAPLRLSDTMSSGVCSRLAVGHGEYLLAVLPESICRSAQAYSERAGPLR
jgi:hypothetical protein